MSEIADLGCLDAYVLAYYDFPGSRTSSPFEVMSAWIRCWYWMGRTMLGSPHYRKAFDLAFVCMTLSHCVRTLREGRHMEALACTSRSHFPTIPDFAAQMMSHGLNSCMNYCRDLRKNCSIRSAASRRAASLQSSVRISLKKEHKSAAGCRR